MIGRGGGDTRVVPVMMAIFSAATDGEENGRRPPLVTPMSPITAVAATALRARSEF